MNPTVHATCVVLGEAGVLIRGASGAGKSTLAAALIERAHATGLFARLVADDRVRLDVSGGRLIASAPAEIGGLLERRGLGITRVPYLSEALVRLVVDIEAARERMPEEASLACEMNGLALPRLVVAARDSEAPGLVLFRAREIAAARACDPMALAFASQHGKMPAATPSSVTPPLPSDRVGMTRGRLCPERNEFCAETA